MLLFGHGRNSDSLSYLYQLMASEEIVNSRVLQKLKDNNSLSTGKFETFTTSLTYAGSFYGKKSLSISSFGWKIKDWMIKLSMADSFMAFIL